MKTLGLKKLSTCCACRRLQAKRVLAQPHGGQWTAEGKRESGTMRCATGWVISIWKPAIVQRKTPLHFCLPLMP